MSYQEVCLSGVFPSCHMLSDILQISRVHRRKSTYLVLTHTLVPEPLVKDLILESTSVSHDTLLYVGNGSCILHYFNHAC